MDGTAVVTGASTPLGRRVARAFAKRGHHVVLGDADRASADAVVEAVESADGSATALRTDVRDEFDLERLMETAAKAGDGIDVVVPAATVTHGTPGDAPLQSASYSAFDDTMRTNARGAFAAIREAVPHLRPDGRVVIPVVLGADPGGRGPFGVAQTSRLAVMRGFAADIEQSVGAVDVGADPETASNEVLEAAVDRIAWAGTTTDPGLDGAILDASGDE